MWLLLEEPSCFSRMQEGEVVPILIRAALEIGTLVRPKTPPVEEKELTFDDSEEEEGGGGEEEVDSFFPTISTTRSHRWTNSQAQRPMPVAHQSQVYIASSTSRLPPLPPPLSTYEPKAQSVHTC